MTLSRSSYFSVVLLLGASLTAVLALAQTTGSTPTPAEQTSTPGATVVEDIVARVNDQIITQSDYDRAVQQLDAEGKQQGVPPQELQERKDNLLRDLIDQQLLLSKGKELGITGEAELVRRLDEIRKQNHLDSMEDLEKAAAAQGVSYEDFKANIRNGIITQQVVRDQVGQHLNMTEGAVMAYYKAHESEFAQPESVRLSEILVPTPADANASQVATAQATADGIAAKLQAGGNFADLAKASSAGSTAAQGGDLGEFRRGMLAPVLEEKTFSLQAGQFTAPIRTKQGFVILEVTHHTAGGDAGFKDVEPQVEQAVFMEQMQPALRRYLTKLREAAYIDIKPGFVDSGASPNEMRLTNSAYVPPGPRKKKTFARARFRGRVHSQTTKTQVASSPAAATKKTTQVASANSQKPGKREKIRFGQAPRESLPPAQNNASALASGDNKTNTSPSQTANLNNPDVHVVNSDGSISSESPAPVKEKKTRFSQRPVVHKAKKVKTSTATADDSVPPPTADELATQKVQDAPLGLAGQTAKTKKKKTKGEKTRMADRPKAPEQPPQQPYQPQSTETNPPPASQQPAPKSSDGTSPQ